MTTSTECTLPVALAELLDHCRDGDYLPNQPYLFAFYADPHQPYDVTPDADTVAGSTASLLLSLAERLYAGQPLATQVGQPLPAPQALALLHTEPDRVTEDTTIRVIDAIDIHGHALTGCLDPYRPGTRTPGHDRPNLTHLRRLLYAATREPRLLDGTDLAMITPFVLLTRSTANTTTAACTRADPVGSHAIGQRAAQFAALAMALAAPARIDWQEAIQAAAIEPGALRDWLDHTARLLALDLMQVLTALAWDQLNDLSGSPLRALANQAHHLAELTDTWLRLHQERDTLLAATTRLADRCALLDDGTTQPADQATD